MAFFAGDRLPVLARMGVEELRPAQGNQELRRHGEVPALSRTNGCATSSPEVWVPAKFKGKPFNIFETGGTTGMPKQRIGWEDYKTDYSGVSRTKSADEHFPRGGAWLMMGPTGPRRLRPRHRASRARARARRATSLISIRAS